MRTIYENLREVFTNIWYILGFIFLFTLFVAIFQYFTDLGLIAVNLGKAYLYFTLGSQFLISLLLAIFITLSVYKFNYFRKFSVKEQSSSLIGGISSFLVAGCPSCSITLASYFGLGGLIAFLPYYGLELKIIAILILLYSNFSVLKSLKQCSIKKHNM